MRAPAYIPPFWNENTVHGALIVASSMLFSCLLRWFSFTPADRRADSPRAHIHRCGNVASILELDDQLGQEYKVFAHAPSVRTSLPRPLSPSPSPLSHAVFPQRSGEPAYPRGLPPPSSSRPRPPPTPHTSFESEC